MNRRSFITGIIAACAAPAIVRSGLLMPVKPQISLTLDDFAERILNPAMQRLAVDIGAGYRVGDFIRIDTPSLFTPWKTLHPYPMYESKTFMITSIIGADAEMVSIAG